jgi:putative transposase
MRTPNPIRGFRYPAEVIEYAVWFYYCFNLSLREIKCCDADLREKASM